MNRTCEMFGCVRPANQFYSLASGTNLWLCPGCAETEGFEYSTKVPEIHKLLDTERAPGKLACRHHWIIGPADGPVSVGVCKICSETREFKNSIDTSDLDSAHNLRFAPLAEDQGDELSGS